MSPSSPSRPGDSPECADRYYDPATGQFLSVDPKVGETQAPYIYASHDPVPSAEYLRSEIGRIPQRGRAQVIHSGRLAASVV
jgi:hypothetical protein